MEYSAIRKGVIMVEIREILEYAILGISIACLILGIVAFASVLGQVLTLDSQNLGFMGWTIYFFSALG